MNRSLRVTAGVALTTVGLLTSSLLAGAAGFTVDPIMKNDLKIKTTPAKQLVVGGSSFDAPLVLAAQAQWNTDTGKTPIAAYNTTKSGTGRANAISGAYNIGFSDFPLNQSSTPDVGPGSANPSLSTSDFVQVPVVLGGVAIIYHLGSGVSGSEATLIAKHGITVNGSVLGQIFAGKITNWDSPAIGKLNTDLYIKGKDALPNLPIVVDSRTSGSGTTFIFKDYLSRVDKTDFPKADSNAFTAAASTYANSGLLDQGVHATAGAIGYVEYGYAVANGTANLNLVNASGKVVKLSEAGIIQAATVGVAKISKQKGGFNTNSLSGFSINNEVGATVYPIAGFSYAIVWKNQNRVAGQDLAGAIAAVKFLDFLSHQGGGKSKATTFGQDLSDANGYAPMPLALQKIARTLLLGVQFGGKAVLSATN